MVTIVNQIDCFRKQFLDQDMHAKLFRLDEVEKRIVTLQGAHRARSLIDRVEIFKGMHALRVVQLFGKRSPSTFESTHHLKDSLERIRPMVGKKADQVSDEAITAWYVALSEEDQHLLYEYVWVLDGCPQELEYGRKKVERDLFVLLEPRQPFVCLQGTSLIDQLYYKFEHQYSLIKQQEIVTTLTQIKQSKGKEKELRTHLAKLPEKLLHLLHGDVYHCSSGVKEGFEWGGEALEKDPSLLFTLTFAGGKSIIEHHIYEQNQHLEGLVPFCQLEEFERIVALYPQLSHTQRSALLKHVSPKVKEWVNELIKIYPQDPYTQGIVSPTLHRMRGARFLGKTTSFNVFAPQAKAVTLLLTAYGKVEHELSMTKNGFGEWTLKTELAQPGRTYQYQFDGADGVKRVRIDPYSFSTSEENGTAYSIVVDPHSFSWKDHSWIEKRTSSQPPHSPSIYEVHVDSWKREKGVSLNFRELAHELVKYSKEMGFTHVELYGVLDHKLIVSWGYQVDNYFAPNHRLGSSDDFKYLVDYLHQHQIGVIVDWIPTHFKHDHFNEKFNTSVLHRYDGSDLLGTEASLWGTLFFDFNKEEARHLLKASALHWIDYFHVDGLRYDAVGLMIKREKVAKSGAKVEHPVAKVEHPAGKVEYPAAIAFLQDLNTTIHREFPGIVLLAEELDGYPGVTKPVKEGGLGFDLRLACNWHYHMTGFLSKSLGQRKAHHGELVWSLSRFKEASDEVLSHTHDDTSVQNHGKALYHMSAMDTPAKKCADLRNLYAYQGLAQHSGTLIHMGEELGQRVAWDQSMKQQRSAVEWEAVLSDHADAVHHRGVRNVVKEINLLRTTKPEYWQKDGGGITVVNTSDSDNNVISYYRRDKKGNLLLIVHNFSDNAFPSYDLIFPPTDLHCAQLKTAREIFNSDDKSFGGKGEHRNESTTILRNEKGVSWGLQYKLPPLATLVFECS